MKDSRRSLRYKNCCALASRCLFVCRCKLRCMSEVFKPSHFESPRRSFYIWRALYQIYSERALGLSRAFAKAINKWSAMPGDAVAVKQRTHRSCHY